MNKKIKYTLKQLNNDSIAVYGDNTLTCIIDKYFSSLNGRNPLEYCTEIFLDHEERN